MTDRRLWKDHLFRGTGNFNSTQVVPGVAVNTSRFQGSVTKLPPITPKVKVLVTFTCLSHLTVAIFLKLLRITQNGKAFVILKCENNCTLFCPLSL